MSDIFLNREDIKKKWTPVVESIFNKHPILLPYLINELPFHFEKIQMLSHTSFQSNPPWNREPISSYIENLKKFIELISPIKSPFDLVDINLREICTELENTDALVLMRKLKLDKINNHPF